jgi:hypothetical protein
MTKARVDETLATAPPPDPKLHDTLAEILARVKVARAPDGPTPDELDELHRVHDRRRKLANEYGVPEKELGRLVGTAPIADTESMKFARDFWHRHATGDPDGRILVLAGPYGVGKTTAAAWLVAKGPPRPYTLGHVDRVKDPRVGGDWPVARHPRFVCAGDLATMSPIDDLFKALLECSVLAIDDLGMEIPDADGRLMARLDRVIDARYRRGVWTVITTNLTAEEFRNRYTPRIVSRLIEAGEFCVVPGKNMRA